MIGIRRNCYVPRLPRIPALLRRERDKLVNNLNMVYRYDYLVIGSGIAGMSFALKAAKNGKVAIICKSSLDEANTFFAQGGVASVTLKL